jgi:hypothetical protein
VVNGTNNDWPIPKYIERARSVTTWQIPAGWDHEHCMLCVTKIAQLPECQREGYNNEEGDLWLCVAGYERYISPSQK